MAMTEERMGYRRIVKILFTVLTTCCLCVSRASSAGAAAKLPNVLWILLDDISTERFPEYGNTALQGLLPGWDRLKRDGAVYYEHFYSPSSLCSPSQVGLFSGIEPADIGGQYHLSQSNVQGKAKYATVPPPEVKFFPEILRTMGYWSVAGGKLDYQVADVIPTFYNAIAGGGWSDITSYQDEVWDPAIAMGRPFFGMLNIMDMHQLVSTFSREGPVTMTSRAGTPPPLPFGPFGYAKPLSLIFEGPDGQPVARPVVQTNLVSTDIVGYEGDFNETSLTHANGGVPGYLPEEIGIQSILAREYDLIRNVDYRITQIIDALEERGVYNDTMIAVFGDHGSATYKAKSLLEPQSLRTPLWIKYPVGTELPTAVTTRTASDGGGTYLVDDRMTSILDLFPTTLSVLGVAPPDWITAGLPLAGKYAVGRTRDVLFAIVQRAAEISGWKSFAAFTKNYHYQRNMVTTETIAEFSATVPEEDLAAALGTVPVDSSYERKFNVFAASPIFDRVRRLLRINGGSDPDFVEKYGIIASDDATAPSEVFYDLKEDIYGTNNLIIDYDYNVTLAGTVQPWGSNVSKVTVAYGPINETGLSSNQSTALGDLRKALDAWIDTQKWVTHEFVFGKGGFAEENAMAEVFWPGGIQPVTAPVEIVSFDNVEEGVAKANLFAPTLGTVIRYSVASTERRSQCAQISQEAKEVIPEMTITNSGIPLSNYTSLWNKRTYTGYDYSGSILLTTLIGEVPGCGLFVDASATFLEISCPGEQVFAFDTRDSVWNGTTWAGLDESTGEWIDDDPVSFFDSETLKWNLSAFHGYVFGPLRAEIFSGLNADGSPFFPLDGNPAQIPLNVGFNPPPRYWVMDNDVNSIPDRILATQVIRASGWSVIPDRIFFKATATAGFDDKGSFALGILARGVNPFILSPLTYSFDSFDYDCLLWEVGDSASLSFGNMSGLHVFMQGIRKGYADSQIVESFLTEMNVFESKVQTDTPSISPDEAGTTPTNSPIEPFSSPTSASFTTRTSVSDMFGLVVSLSLLLNR